MCQRIETHLAEAASGIVAEEMSDEACALCSVTARRNGRTYVDAHRLRPNCI